MKRYNWILAISLMLAVSCSEPEMPDRDGHDREAVAFFTDVRTTVEDGGSLTRASSPFVSPFDLYLAQTAPVAMEAVPSLYGVEYEEGNFWVKTLSNARIYWDDIGGIGALLDLQGIYPKGLMATYPGSFSFGVAEDQRSSTAYDASDLVISDKMSGYSVRRQKLTDGTKPVMNFNHVMSQVTFIIEKGTGFSVDEFLPTLIMEETPLDCTVTIAGDTGTVSLADGSSTGGIKPYVKSTDSETGKQTLVAIVMPGQKFAVGETIAKVTITIGGNANVYDIKVPADPEELPGGELEFLRGINHTFNVKVNKVGALVTVTLDEWGEGANLTDDNVKISTVGGEELGNDSKLVDGAALYVNIDNKHKTIFAYDKTEGEWNTGTPIYWDDVNWRTGLFGAALLFNTTAGIMADNPESLYTGLSQELKKSDNNDVIKVINFEDMVHPFAKLRVKVQTPAGETGIDLENLVKVVFHSGSGVKKFYDVDFSGTAPGTAYWSIDYHTGAEYDFSPQSGDIKTTGSGSSEMKHYVIDDIYVQPGVTVPEGEFLRLYYNDGTLDNEYPMSLASSIALEKNMLYNITVTATKTEVVEVGVTIKEWETGTDIEGGATIDK